MAANSKWKDVYEWFMVILVLVVVGMLFVEFRVELNPIMQRRFDIADTGILLIFATDYFVRFFYAPKKKAFIKNNIPDLVAIIPFSSLFRMARLARLTRLIRLARSLRLMRAVLWMTRFKDRFRVFIRTNGMIYVVVITVAINVFGAIGIHLLEDMSIADSFWWAFVTTTTVGYGDISPETGAGKLLAAVLMLIGIGFIGMLTGTIATYFLGEGSKEKRSYKHQAINNIKEQIDNLDKLTDEDIDSMAAVLKSIQKQTRE